MYGYECTKRQLTEITSCWTLSLKQCLWPFMRHCFPVKSHYTILGHFHIQKLVRQIRGCKLGPVSWDSMLSLQGLWVWSLVGELRSHMLCDVAKTKQNKLVRQFRWTDNLKPTQSIPEGCAAFIRALFVHLNDSRCLAHLNFILLKHKISVHLYNLGITMNQTQQYISARECLCYSGAIN